MVIDGLGIIATVSYVLDFITAWFYCCVMAIFILPLIIDRVVFYIPKMTRLYFNGEIFLRGVIWSILEAVLWFALVVIIYTVMYFLQPHLFTLTTTSLPAYFAWAVSVVHMIYRVMNFERVVIKNFYYVAYMRYIKPEALKDYQDFINKLDDLSLEELTGLLDGDLPYMHRQAALRKQNENVYL